MGGSLDNIVQFDWHSCQRSDFEMIHMYLLEMKGRVNDALENKWLNTLMMKQVLNDKQIQNIEWMLSTKFQKRHLLMNSSVIMSILNKWKKNDASSNYCILFELTDFKYYKQVCSKWCVVKMHGS